MPETTLASESTPTNDPTLTPRGAYVHIPFCSHKCGYCDFASVAGQDELADAYLDALDAEMDRVLTERPRVSTIFVGGGTPTYLSPRQLATFLSRLANRFELDDGGEFTVESNPNTLTAEKAAVLADYGVNRVSLGAQSFEPKLLKVLERDHDPASVPRAVDLLRRRIDNISLDLIFGAPGQSLSQWQSDLEQLLRLEPDHCSTYGLTYEKGTRLFSQRRLGLVQPVDDELERAMYEHAIDRLREAGWEHYEISNFARRSESRDNRCRHNLLYWSNYAYHGFGTGAAAYVGGTRTLNIRDLGAYIQRCREGRSAVTQSEMLEPEPRARETAMLQLRRLEGVHRDAFWTQTGYRLDALFGDSLPHFVEMGLLADDGNTVRLTRDGLPVADGILQAVL